jgi:hypothetical protein
MIIRMNNTSEYNAPPLVALLEVKVSLPRAKHDPAAKQKDPPLPLVAWF